MPDRAPNTALQQAIVLSGASYEALARDIRRIAAENGDLCSRANKSVIAHWVSGARPRPATARYLAEALARRLRRPISLAELGLVSDETAPVDAAALLTTLVDPVAAIAALGRADVDRRTLLGNTAVYSLGALLLPLAGSEPAARAAAVRSRTSPTVGMADVEAVRSVITAFNSADEKLGGGHGRTAVVEYLATDVAPYLQATYASDTTRSAMFGVAAQLAYLAGWKAHDLGMTGLAQVYYLRAADLAREAEPAQVAYCMRILAHQAMDLGHHQHCVDLAEGALRLTTGRVDPDTESLFLLTAARAYATSGSRRQARTMLLGDLSAAQEQFAAAARCWNPVTHPRIHALTLAELAEAQCRQGTVEAACATWNQAMDVMDGIRSARTRDAVTTLRGCLAPYRRRGLSAVQRLDARAAAFLRS